ncbi:MAG: GNAT family N-acetyltransferase [Alphaproteobacteria bacterium]|jgi:GNAT superfamily N-acetyltransferase
MPLPQPFAIRPMLPHEAAEVAQLIFQSTNHWYESKGFGTIFSGQPDDCLIFADVYEDLDPGCCLIAVDNDTNAIIASCFYHPRASHISLGIMNADPHSNRKGVAKALLSEIIEIAKHQELTLRLVSSAFNLDSFSLYTRQGFAPYSVYQDMILNVPESGMPIDSIPGIATRPATLDDIDAIDQQERAAWNTSRKKDWTYFIENKRRIWSVTIAETPKGVLLGALASINHPGSNLLGPGIATDSNIAKLLIQTELNNHCGRKPLFLIPSNQPELVSAMYQLGARNCELHVAQSLGPPPEIKGIVLPTFMPETG